MATPREQLASILRQARLDAGYESHAALAKRLNVSRPVVSKAENPGSPTPSDAVLAAIAGATGAGLDELAKLAQQARSGPRPPGWFAGWTDDIEAGASVIRWFEPSLVPGLIQTEAYARAVLSWKPESARTEANLASRLARQSVLDRAELRVVVLETVLYREVGDAATMSAQVGHLLEVGGRPAVTLQVLPDIPAVAGSLGGAFAVASQGAADVAVYSESIVEGTVHTDPDLVARAVRFFDWLRAEALPWAQTQDLLRKAGERWTL